MDDSKALICKYIEEVWNQGNPAALENLTTPDYRYHLGNQPGRDRAAMQQFLEMVHTAFPDWRVQIVEVFRESETVGVRWEGKVTHQGPFHGIPPTGRQVVVSGINIYTLKEGKVSREWEQMDSLSMLQQLGVLGPPARKGASGPPEDADDCAGN